MMFPRLEKEMEKITDKFTINTILSDAAFTDFEETNVLPLIYDEKSNRCQIMVFDYSRAMKEVASIVKINPGERRRKHPVYIFCNAQDEYICEVRYGGPDANALQRGLWTHTIKGVGYFESITNGWISYEHNQVLVRLFSHALVSSKIGHELALKNLKQDIQRLRKEKLNES